MGRRPHGAVTIRAVAIVLILPSSGCCRLPGTAGPCFPERRPCSSIYEQQREAPEQADEKQMLGASRERSLGARASSFRGKPVLQLGGPHGSWPGPAPPACAPLRPPPPSAPCPSAPRPSAPGLHPPLPSPTQYPRRPLAQRPLAYDIGWHQVHIGRAHVWTHICFEMFQAAFSKLQFSNGTSATFNAFWKQITTQRESEAEVCKVKLYFYTQRALEEGTVCAYRCQLGNEIQDLRCRGDGPGVGLQ